MKKGIIYIMIANIICLIFNLLTNFILPKYLSIDTYALIKTYALYITYAGFFSLGYNDGMYLKYGGKEISEINKKDLSDNYLNYLVLELIMLFFVAIVGTLTKSTIIIAFSLGMFSTNVLGYLKSLYQATGEFSQYGKALNIEKIVLFVFNMFLIFVFKTDNYIYYVWIQIIVGIFIMIYLTIRLEKQLNFIFVGKISLKQFKENISSGFVLMLGNFSSGIFTGIDRWFVKILMTSTNFAFYSFAVSTESIINVFMTPITVSMYNYFCKDREINKIKVIKSSTLIWGFVVITAAFPAKFILEKFLHEYFPANKVIFTLFAAQVFYVVIKGIYVNIYKVEKKQNKYFLQMLLMLLIGVVLNIILYMIFRSMLSIAMGTLITSIVWLIICELGHKELRFSIKEYIAITIILIIYLFLGFSMNAVYGGIIYIIASVIICLIFMPNSTLYIFKLGLSFIVRLTHKIKKY